MRKFFTVKQAKGETPEVRCGRIYKILSVPVGVMELAAEAAYIWRESVRERSVWRIICLRRRI